MEHRKTPQSTWYYQRADLADLGNSNWNADNLAYRQDLCYQIYQDLEEYQKGLYQYQGHTASYQSLH